MLLWYVFIHVWDRLIICYDIFLGTFVDVLDHRKLVYIQESHNMWGVWELWEIIIQQLVGEQLSIVTVVFGLSYAEIDEYLGEISVFILEILIPKIVIKGWHKDRFVIGRFPLLEKMRKEQFGRLVLGHFHVEAPLDAMWIEKVYTKLVLFT